TTSPTRSSTRATWRSGSNWPAANYGGAMTSPIDLLDAPIAAIMRAQAPVRRLRSDPIDDDTLLTLLELASHATAGSRRRCEFVVVRDPDVRHQLARSYRQGWSIYRRILSTRDRED